MLIYLTLIESSRHKILFEQIYHDYRSSMFRIAARILRDEYLAEDAVSEAFLLIAKNISKISTLSCDKQRGYIVILTRNAALDLYRKRKQQEVPIDSIEETCRGFTIEDEIISAEGYAQLMRSIEELDTKYRDVLKLRYLYEHTTAEISAILGVREGTVRMRISRARSKLISILHTEEGALK